MDFTEYDVKLKELEEDCIEELCHILSVVKADDDPLGVSSTLLKQIAEVLPRSSEVLETLDGMTPAIMNHQEIILTITEEYQQMKRKLLLKKRMVKNRERMNLTKLLDFYDHEVLIISFSMSRINRLDGIVVRVSASSFLTNLRSII